MAGVLVVDDAAFVRLTIKKMLEAHDHHVAGEAENGEEAIRKYKEIKPDVVLLDLTMPEMNGVEALRQIIAYDPNAKIIICSAMGQQAMVVNAIESGAIDFVVKPFEEERLIKSVEKAMTM